MNPHHPTVRKRCPYCSQDIPEIAKYCTQCGRYILLSEAGASISKNYSPSIHQTTSSPQHNDADDEFDRPIKCPNLDHVFAAGGPVAQLLGERYRPRPGQKRVANLIRRVLQERKHAVVEAGTGIGKSFAYLVPAIWSGTPAVISTSNKALMTQLWHEDIPRLQKIAPRPFTPALLKGRSNYICALRLEAFLSQSKLPGFSTDSELVGQSLNKIPSGDCEEMGLPRKLIDRLTVNHRDCEGRKCEFFSQCFYEQAKNVALAADIVVTNHALLCQSVLRSDNPILPVRPVLIIDEAHELERYAINVLTQQLVYDGLWGIVNHEITKDAIDEEILEQARENYASFFRALDRQRPDPEIEKWALTGEIQEGLRLWAIFDKIRNKVERHRVESEMEGRQEKLTNHMAELQAIVYALAQKEPENYIRYCELNNNAKVQGYEAYEANYRPLEVASTLARSLFDVWPRVICTSATLSVNNDTNWFRRQVGMPENDQVLSDAIPSPFNYKQHVLIYTPQGIIFVKDNEEEYESTLAYEIQRLIEASRGRAFVLCTSRRRMFRLYERLSPLLNYTCYCQNKGLSRLELLKQFKDKGDAILFGTRSFWEGVDIPGAALSLVILDKIPFLPPEDPVLDRQSNLIKSRGGNPFEELQLANAILTIRQGAGRLIRSETDRGVIALLDSRIYTKQYGKRIFQALPNGCQTSKFEDVQNFFADQ